MFSICYLNSVPIIDVPREISTGAMNARVLQRSSDIIIIDKLFLIYLA